MSISFNEYFMFIPFILFLFSFWSVFFKLINSTNLINSELDKNRKIKNVNTPKQNYFFVLVEYYLLGTVTLFLMFFCIHGKNNISLFNHFVFTEFHVRIFLFFLTISFMFYFILYASIFDKVEYPLDFFFSLLNLLIFLPILFCVNNFFTFLFVLELISCFLFYMLSASKIWYKNIEDVKINIKNEKPQLYINMIFFQYWITFFSTIFIIYAILNIFYFFGTTEWCLFNFVNNMSNITTLNITKNNSFFISTVLIFSVFLKLGVSPIHLFKIETYKGIPYLSILFYTTYYFIIIFFMFLCLIDENFLSFINFYYYIFLLILFLGLVYVTTLLFDVNYLKAFFAYSTIINSLGFLVLFISRF